MSDATPKLAHFGSAKINTRECCIVGPEFTILENLNPRKFAAQGTSKMHLCDSITGKLPNKTMKRKCVSLY